MAKTVNNWDQTNSELVKIYQTEPDPRVQNKIILKLIPSLKKIIHTTLYNFFRNNEQKRELTNDIITHLVINTFPAFDFNKHEMNYTYLNKVVLFYFLKKQRAESAKHKDTLCLFNEDHEIIFDNPAVEDEKEESLKLMELKVVNHLHSLKYMIKRRKETLDFFDILIQLIKTVEYDKYYYSYYLMKETGLTNSQLSHMLMNFRISRLVTKNLSYEFYCSYFDECKNIGEIKDKSLLIRQFEFARNSAKHKKVVRYI